MLRLFPILCLFINAIPINAGAEGKSFWDGANRGDGIPAGSIDFGKLQQKSSLFDAASFIPVPTDPEGIAWGASVCVGVFAGENKQMVSSGSGIIVDPKGILLTNAHVVQMKKVGEEVSIAWFTNANKQNSMPHPETAVVLAMGTPEARDVAVLQIKSARSQWPAVAIDQPLDANLKAGASVYTLGCPLGAPLTITNGVIGRFLNEDKLWIAMDAAVNPGNSGGGLFSTDWKFLGMNTKIISKSGGFEGQAFAISVNDLNHWYKQYKRGDGLESPWLGIAVMPHTPLSAENPGSGVDVAKVFEDGPGKEFLLPGDNIVEFDNQLITDVNSLLFKVERLSPKDTVTLGIHRKIGDTAKINSISYPIKLGVRQPKEIKVAHQEGEPTPT